MKQEEPERMVDPATGNGHLELADNREWGPVEMEVDVAIAGGGLGGLSLALGLQTRGIQAHVFEKAPALRTDSATGISLAPNGIRALDGLHPGLAEQMIDLGNDKVRLKKIIRRNGEEDIVIPVGHKIGDVVVIGWRFSQELLASLLDKSSVHCNHRFVRYRPAPGGVDIEFQITKGLSEAFGSVKVVRAKLLVGADGMWSGVRKTMVPGDAPRYLNFVNWNAFVYNPNGELFRYGKNEVQMLHAASGRVVAFISDQGHGYVLWHLRVLDTNGELQKDFLERSRKFNRSESKALALQQLAALEGWEDLISAIKATDDSVIYERRSMDRLPLKKWSDANGHVLLIGDAAHGMYTSLGMGARLAFEDAHQLSLLLEKAFESRGEDSIPAAVHKFEEIRIPRINRLHEYATELTEQAEFVPQWVSKLSVEQQMQRFSEIILWTGKYPDCMHGDPTTTYWK